MRRKLKRLVNRVPRYPEWSWDHDEKENDLIADRGVFDDTSSVVIDGARLKVGHREQRASVALLLTRYLAQVRVWAGKAIISSSGNRS
jgi:hypothetical protein